MGRAPVRPCPHQPLQPDGGPAIETLILLLFGLTTAVILGVAIVRMITRSSRAREAGLDTTEQPRTDEQKARDKQTAVTWGCLLVAVPSLLALAYFFTR